MHAGCQSSTGATWFSGTPGKTLSNSAFGISRKGLAAIPKGPECSRDSGRIGGQNSRHDRKILAQRRIHAPTVPAFAITTSGNPCCCGQACPAVTMLSGTDTSAL